MRKWSLKDWHNLISARCFCCFNARSKCSQILSIFTELKEKGCCCQESPTQSVRTKYDNLRMRQIFQCKLNCACDHTVSSKFCRHLTAWIISVHSAWTARMPCCSLDVSCLCFVFVNGVRACVCVCLCAVKPLTKLSTLQRLFLSTLFHSPLERFYWEYPVLLYSMLVWTF